MGARTREGEKTAGKGIALAEPERWRQDKEGRRERRGGERRRVGREGKNRGWRKREISPHVVISKSRRLPAGASQLVTKIWAVTS